MNTIRVWDVQEDALPDYVRVCFEDRTILVWQAAATPRKLELTKDDGQPAADVRAFVEDHHGIFEENYTELLQALNEAFPSRPIPAPVSGYALIAQQQGQHDLVDYVLTSDITITYSESTGRVEFLGQDEGVLSLRAAFDQAFPLGLSVLSYQDMTTVLQALCQTSQLIKADTSQLGNTKAVNESAAYKPWYPFETVRLASRPGEPCQEEVMDEWSKTLNGSGKSFSKLGRHLLVHAPTGLGKTSTALAPALAWQQQNPKRRQIYYLVATANQHDNPIQELQRLYRLRAERGLKTSLKVVDLVGKHQLTQDESTFCIAPDAPQLDPICKESRKSASWAAFLATPISWRQASSAIRGFGQCPYHYLQGLMESADVVVCDYWWVFNQDAEQVWPRTNKFGERDVALIVDEAHNLIPRVRNADDVEIRRDALQERLETTDNAAAREGLMPLLDLLFDGDHAQVATKQGLSPQDVLQHLDRSTLDSALKFWEQKLSDQSQERNKRSVEERIIRHLLVTDQEAQDVVIYTVANQPTPAQPLSSDPALHIRRVDATRQLVRGYARVRASITISGTLVAPGESKDELQKLVPQFGLPVETTQVLKAGTPFVTANQLWVYSSTSYGTYQQREQYLSYYRHAVVEIGKATKGGVTAVFFSSYSFMQLVLSKMPAQERALVVAEDVAEPIEGGGDEAPASAKTRSLEEYEMLLRRAVGQPGNDDQRAYLFAVYAGKLAQGANFRQNLIKTVICVSVPAEMPQLFHHRLSQQLWPLLYPAQEPPIASPFNPSDWDSAWQYAYERPAMQQVLQATGRGIRTQTDRCAFVLLDRRYHQFKWHDFLRPVPFHTDSPALHVKHFHEGGPQRFLEVRDEWEPLLSQLKPLSNS